MGRLRQFCSPRIHPRVVLTTRRAAVSVVPSSRWKWVFHASTATRAE
jgi:hypothetical protein